MPIDKLLRDHRGTQLNKTLASTSAQNFYTHREKMKQITSSKLEMEQMCDRLVHAGGTLHTSELLFPGNLSKQGLENKILFGMFQHGASRASLFDILAGLESGVGAPAFHNTLQKMRRDGTITRNIHGRLRRYYYYSVHNAPILLPSVPSST